MKKQIKPGFFSMEDCHAVFGMKDVFQAKKYAHDRVSAYCASHPGTLKENVDKAASAINACSTVRKLGEMIASFVLAHDSENLKVIR